MSTRYALRTAISASLFTLLFALPGCAPDETLDDEAVVGSGHALTPIWTRCATNGRVCNFTGTRQVRYGANGVYRYGTFTNSVQCSGSSFGGSSNRNYVCDYDAANPTTPPDMSHMPYVNEALIPTGVPGFSGARVRSTTERPVRSADDTGAFRTICEFSHMNFDDPLLYPGKERASHLHVFFGNTETDAYSTETSLRTTGNSTCLGGTANRTAYWVPAVVDSTGRPQTPASAVFYYKTGYNLPASSIRQFPAGLRMIAGDPTASSTQEFAGWGCLESYIPMQGTIPNCGTGNHVVMTVYFPQCWNGRDLDSPDHRSHMAYPDGNRCPSTHPVPIPIISFNIYYKVPASGVSTWRLASDMYSHTLRGGYSAHADWFDGWDPNIAKAWVQNCDNKAMDCHAHLLGDGRELY